MSIKRVPSPDIILKFRGKLMRVIGIWTGEKIIHMQALEPPCPHCGHTYDSYQAESSLNFQNGAEPVETITQS